MAVREIAGKQVEVDEDNHLKDAASWNREIAAALAAEEGVGALTERHWKVIDFMRADTQANGTPPTIRRLTKNSGVETKELYQLFPNGPAKKAARIAGLPKPRGCI